jgi:hypothetical protein
MDSPVFHAPISLFLQSLFAGTVIGFSTIANRMAGVPERYVTPVRWATVSAALKFNQIASHSVFGSSLLGKSWVEP